MRYQRAPRRLHRGCHLRLARSKIGSPTLSSARSLFADSGEKLVAKLVAGLSMTYAYGRRNGLNIDSERRRRDAGINADGAHYCSTTAASATLLLGSRPRTHGQVARSQDHTPT